MSESDQDSLNSTTLLSGDYFNKLAMISNHPFVTAESVKRRKQLTEFDSVLSEKSKNIADHAVVPLGSVAVGVAKIVSDIDGIVFFISDPNKNSSLIHKKLSEDHRFRHVNVVNFNFALNDDWAIDYLTSDAESSMVLTGLNRLSFVFAPTLAETRDPNAPINQMRRMLLQKIVTVYPDKAEMIWNAIANNINHYLVDYEHLQFGSSESTAQRPIKVADAIDTVLDARFPDTDKKQKVRQIIDRRRENFKYPDLQSMLDTFGVSR